MKLTCISASPMPYNTPVLNALARQLDLHVIYMSGEDHIDGFADVWGESPTFEYSFFRSKSVNVGSVDLQAQLSIGVSRRLARLRPDAILVVSWKPVVIEPLLWSRRAGCGAVMWSESTNFSGLLRGRVSTQIRRSIIRITDSFLTNGSQATAFLETLGASTERIVTSCLPSGAPVTSGAVTGGQTPGAGVRFLYVGRLIPRKRPVELIHAFAHVRRALPDATLTIVGGGELEGEVRGATARNSGVHYAGFHEGRDLEAYYTAADVLVLPARREVWGLVVNEALAHGLFVVATDEVGSAYDLLDERCGLMVPADDLERLPTALIDAAKDLDVSDAARLGRAAAVAHCTPERFATDICRAVDLAVERRR